MSASFFDDPPAGTRRTPVVWLYSLGVEASGFLMTGGGPSSVEVEPRAGSMSTASGLKPSHGSSRLHVAGLVGQLAP